MKVTTHHICPPIPVRCADWVAHFDGREEDGPYGHGSTERAALRQLLWLTKTTDETKSVCDALVNLGTRS